MKAAILFILIFVSQLSGAEKFSLYCKNDLLKMSGIIAVKQAGVLERGNNRGKVIEKYLASAGLRTGLPYCAAGQYWCFAEACRNLQIPYQNIPIPRTGLANAMYNYAKRHGKKVRFHPAVDDLIVWRRGKTSFGHIERIVARGKAGWVLTIGFNTVKYIEGKRYEGVFIHRRNVYAFLGRMHIRGLIGFYTGGSDDTRSHK